MITPQMESLCGTCYGDSERISESPEAQENSGVDDENTTPGTCYFWRLYHYNLVGRLVID